MRASLAWRVKQLQLDTTGRIPQQVGGFSPSTTRPLSTKRMAPLHALLRPSLPREGFLADNYWVPFRLCWVSSNKRWVGCFSIYVVGGAGRIFGEVDGSSPTIMGLLSNRWWEDEEGLAGCGILLPPGHLTWLCRLPITPTQTRATLYAANNQINQNHPNRHSNHVQEFGNNFGFQYFTFQKQVGWVTRRGHPLLPIIVT